jgi:hypothetical protein
MLKPIAAALEALALAKECGGELDLDYYAKAHQTLKQFGYWAVFDLRALVTYAAETEAA